MHEKKGRDKNMVDDRKSRRRYVGAIINSVNFQGVGVLGEFSIVLKSCEVTKAKLRNRIFVKD